MVYSSIDYQIFGYGFGGANAETRAFGRYGTPYTCTLV